MRSVLKKTCGCFDWTKFEKDRENVAKISKQNLEISNLKLIDCLASLENGMNLVEDLEKQEELKIEDIPPESELSQNKQGNSDGFNPFSKDKFEKVDSTDSGGSG